MLKYLNFKYSDGRIEMKVHSVYYPLCRILIINLRQTKLKEILMAFIDETPRGRNNSISYPNISYTIHKVKKLLLRFFFNV